MNVKVPAVAHKKLFFLFISILLLSVGGCSKDDIQKPVTVVSWGGQYQKSLFEDWIKPQVRERKLGIPIEGRSYTGEYKTITGMVISQSVTWDLVQVETYYAELARQNGWLEKFERGCPKNRVNMPEGLDILKNYACPTIGWAYVLAWNTETLKERAGQAPTPKSWKDFWDTKTYPGPRALRDVAQGNIEIALLADGLSMDEVRRRLYQEEDLSLVTRAFRKLDEIRSHVELWWKSGDQLQRELESGRSTMVAAWNGRVWLANTRPISAASAKPSVRLVFHQAVLDYDWWIIPKGARNPAGAAEVVGALYEDVEGAIAFARSLGYGPPVQNWETLLRKNDELLAFMPTTKEHLSQQLVSSPSFWAKYHEQISDQWRRWKAE